MQDEGFPIVEGRYDLSGDSMQRYVLYCSITVKICIVAAPGPFRALWGGRALSYQPLAFS